MPKKADGAKGDEDDPATSTKEDGAKGGKSESAAATKEGNDEETSMASAEKNARVRCEKGDKCRFLARPKDNEERLEHEAAFVHPGDAEWESAKAATKETAKCDACGADVPKR